MALVERLTAYLITGVLWGYIAATQLAGLSEEEGEEMVITEDPNELGYLIGPKVPDAFPAEWLVEA